MRKKILSRNNYFRLFILLFPLTVFSQKISDLYVNMPDVLNPTLTKQNRLELLEYHRMQQSDSIANRFGNQVYVLNVDTVSNLIVVRTTENTTLEMKILKMENRTPIIGIIHTVCSPICQSHIQFYDTAWHIIPLKFTMPLAKKWLNVKQAETDNNDSNWIKNVLATNFVSLHFSTENDIIASNNTLEFLSDADRKIVSPYLLAKTITYRLVNGLWVCD